MNEYMDLIGGETMTCVKSKNGIQIKCDDGHCSEVCRKQKLQNLTYGNFDCSSHYNGNKTDC